MVGTGIAVVDGLEVTVEDFYRRYLVGNTPALVVNAALEWPLVLLHTTPTQLVEALANAFQNTDVPVVDSGNGSASYGEERRVSMPLREYARRWREGCCRGLYLKDWHFTLAARAAAAATKEEGALLYKTPRFFEDDWLNWFWDRVKVTSPKEGRDDYRFVYMGPEGTWTPLHHDVMLSFSWSYNVLGRKRWYLFPPSETGKLYDRHGRNLAPDARCGSSEEFPCLGSATAIEVVQEPGTFIFVPSGWHHQVHNLEDCVSVNHNWFNGSNVRRVWHFLRDETDAVRREIAHCREEKKEDGGDDASWERQVELILRCNSAINLSDFWLLVTSKASELLLAEEDESVVCHSLAELRVVIDELSRPPYREHIFVDEVKVKDENDVKSRPLGESAAAEVLRAIDDHARQRRGDGDGDAPEETEAGGGLDGGGGVDDDLMTMLIMGLRENANDDDDAHTLKGTLQFMASLDLGLAVRARVDALIEDIVAKKNVFDDALRGGARDLAALLEAAVPTSATTGPASDAGY